MKHCIMCGCILEDSYEDNICHCCLDDLYESQLIDDYEEVLYE